jgi:hypothetical protein
MNKAPKLTTATSAKLWGGDDAYHVGFEKKGGIYKMRRVESTTLASSMAN